MPPRKRKNTKKPRTVSEQMDARLKKRREEMERRRKGLGRLGLK